MEEQRVKKKLLIITTIPASFHFFKGQVRVLKKGFDIEFVSSPGRKLDYFSDLEGVISHSVLMNREISILQDIRSLFKLIKLLKKIKPDIIHGNTPKGGFLSMVAGWFVRVPHRIYCVHGLRYQGAKGFKRRLLITMEKFACKLATDVFTVSFGVKKTLKEDGISNKDVNIIWNGSVNGIDTDYFSVSQIDSSAMKKQLKLTSDNFVFGFVGRLVKDKGVNELIQAFLGINKKYPHTKLLLVGSFEEADPVEPETKSEIENNENIIYVGFQREIRLYLNLMDLFTFPSYREGFGISLMEAAAMNVPAISSNISGCNEIIKDGYNGKLISSKSAIELQEAMETFLLNPELVKSMSSVSRKYVDDRYNQKKLWEKALEYYLKLVGDV